MAPSTGHPRPRPLTRARVLECAVEVADERGIGSLTIRSLAAELGVKPMTVYHHVSGKEAILDGIVDLVFAQMEAPDAARSDWHVELRQRARATRRVLRRHAWAIGLLESRKTPGPATLHHREETVGILRRAGFSVEETAHAFVVLDSFVHGFVLQEVARPFGAADGGAEGAQAFPDAVAYPHLAELADQHVRRPGYDFGAEFELGLDLILGALSRSLRGPVSQP